jgi:hypothetical protein
VYDWVRDHFSESSAQPENLTSREVEELYELQSDCTLMMRLPDLPMGKFWISVTESNEYFAAVFNFLHV